MSRGQTLTLFLVSILIAAGAMTGYAQDDAKPASPCELPEAGQFDFWVGEWNLTWPDTSKPDGVATGTNIITKELGGCVVEENFTTHDDEPFVGNSLSVYSARQKMWKQTWVDNSGGYLDFTGQFEGGKMILSRPAKDREGNPIMQRMVWFNIKGNSLDWNWERSKDDGKTWETLWAIHYERKM